MTETSAARHRQHALRVKGLQAMAAWMEPYSTVPVSDYLADVVHMDSPESLASVAFAHNLDGPHTAADKSLFVYQAFGGGVTWQAVYRPDTNYSNAEQHARAWADTHGYILVPRIHDGSQP